MASREKNENDASASGGGGYEGENMKRARLKSTLSALLDDPILSDVPKMPSLSDVDTLISLELGSAMRISVLKLDGTSFGMALSLSPPLSLTFSQTFGAPSFTKACFPLF